MAANTTRHLPLWNAPNRRMPIIRSNAVRPLDRANPVLLKLLAPPLSDAIPSSIVSTLPHAAPCTSKNPLLSAFFSLSIFRHDFLNYLIYSNSVKSSVLISNSLFFFCIRLFGHASISMLYIYYIIISYRLPHKRRCNFFSMVFCSIKKTHPLDRNQTFFFTHWPLSAFDKKNKLNGWLTLGWIFVFYDGRWWTRTDGDPSGAGSQDSLI